MSNFSSGETFNLSTSGRSSESASCFTPSSSPLAAGVAAGA